MPSTNLVSEFTSAKSYSVSPFITTAWTNPSNALTSNAASTTSGGNNTYTFLLGMRGLSGYLQIPDSATITGFEIVIIMGTVASNGNGNITGYFKLVKATDSRVGTEKTQSIPVGSGGSYTIGYIVHLELHLLLHLVYLLLHIHSLHQVQALFHHLE